jgi:hypothetical protein
MSSSTIEQAADIATPDVAALEKAAIDAIAANNEIGHKSIKATIAAGTALSVLKSAIEDGDQQGGFEAWCQRQKLNRSSAYRYMTFAKRYEQVTHARGRKLLAACHTVAECNDVFKLLAGGVVGPRLGQLVDDRLRTGEWLVWGRFLLRAAAGQ